jgi:hypothetical protein
MRTSVSIAVVVLSRPRRYVALLVAASLFGVTSVAGATTWAVSVISGTNHAEAQSKVFNAPTGGTAASPKSTSLVISWSAPSGGATPTGYQVQRNGEAVPSGSGCCGTIATTTCTDTALAANTGYTYGVVALLVGTNWKSAVSLTFVGTTNATFAVTAITSTNAPSNTVGKMGIGDTFAVTFNYAVNPSTINMVTGSSTQTLVGSSSSTAITISGLTSASGFTVASNYVNSTYTSAAAGTLSLSNSNKTVTFTVSGTPSNSTQLSAGSAKTFTFVPLSTIADTSGDTAATSYSQSVALQIF